MKFAVGMEYDGADFYGWQSQPSRRTVQDAMEAALSAVAVRPVAVCAAGRTDAGAHATLMTAHFSAPVERSPDNWATGASARLPPSAQVLWVCPVGEGFHARHHAVRRYYQYILQNRDAHPGLNAGRVGFCRASLDVEAMRDAAARLLGERDFSAFRAAACQAKSPVRRLLELHIHRVGDLLLFDFCGDAFLHHMVRNIVGALEYVGRGRQPPEWVEQLLAGGDRNLSAPTAAADGLYFCGARYAESLPEFFRPAPLVAAADLWRERFANGV